MTPLLGASALFLVSFWKPIILLIPFIGWAYVVSRVYDKHASRFHLNRTLWNGIHLSVGLAAFLVALLMPIRSEAAFWVGLGVFVVVLAVDLVAYAVVANRDERVPEEFHIKFDQFFKKMAEARETKAAAKRQGKVELVIRGMDKKELVAPEAETPEFELRIAAEAMVLKAMDVRAAQADIGPTGRDSTYQVSYLVDGVRQPGDTLPAASAIKVVDFWKNAAHLDLADRRRKLTGELNVEHGAERAKVRITTMGSAGGVRMSMVFDPEKAVRRKSEALGLLENQLAELKAIVEDGQGVVLLAAPADMGRTTTFYSVMRMHDAYTTNVQSVEMEPQDALEGVRQNQYEQTGEGPEYSTYLRSIVRRDPQVVGVAEMPDESTAKEIVRADLERTRIYLSLRTDNAVTALQAWMKSVGDADAGAKALHGVVAQKLLRKLCINCRVAYQPSPDMVKKLGVKPEQAKQLFKKGGQVLIKNKPEVCPVCRGIGYVGQEGIFEVYRIQKPERELIRAGNWSALKAEFRKRKLPSIQEAALVKALTGVTSVEELIRVTMDQKPEAKPAGAKPAAPPSAASAGTKPGVGSAR
jgi:type II secretory ATPase GspE/PulE/Tfp pilus assembly ATPase PilB-like protein